jgi:sensor domain CHASE-containing protein
MGLRTKALVITFVTLCCLACVLVGAGRRIVMLSFEQLEKETAARNVTRAVNALLSDLSAMGSTAQDWAGWTATYDYVQDSNAAYEEENLAGATLPPLALDFMLFVDLSGEVVNGIGCDLTTGEPAPFPASLEAGFGPDSSLIQHAGTDTTKQGILALPEGPVLIVSAPITNSERTAPARGTVVLGRFLHASQLTALSERTQLAVELYRTDDEEAPADVREALLAFSGGEKAVVRTLSETEVVGYALMADMYGGPAWAIRSVQPRDIHARGRTTVGYFVIAIIGIIAVAGLVNHLLLERIVLNRVSRLSGNVRDIGVTSDASARVAVEGDDELTGLPNRVLFEDRMGAALRQARRGDHGLAVMLLDLDRFKMVNDTFGHRLGDELLAEAAGRLRSSIREGDTAARIGGDEFAALLIDIDGPADAAQVVERVMEVFARPFGLQGH